MRQLSKERSNQRGCITLMLLLACVISLVVLIGISAEPRNKVAETIPVGLP